ncbi:MAG: terpene cyclase/mutase family protein [bacterium]|nr:terpene cyclase/mutase family protein [bacterium]
MNTKNSILYTALVAGAFFLPLSASAADVTISVRYQDTLLYTGSVLLPGAGTVVLSDVDGVPHTINAQSVLAVLSQVDAANPSFAISQLQYFPSFGSLYLRCITVPSEACDNWQYVVDDASPFVGMDAKVLAGGEVVYVYFGNPHQVVLNTSSVASGESLTATAQRYQYQDNTWAQLSGVTLGVRSGSSVIMQSPVNSEGAAQFVLNTSPGSYTIGIAEDFYFPSFALSVRSSGGASAFPIQRVEQKKESPKFDVDKATQFLVGNQSSDGSFKAPLLSDWAAIALGGTETEAREKLKEYLVSHPNPGTSLTDYERRSMALMALGINPYSGTSVNTIEKITQSFDGSQFGSTALFNDDIFALLVLLKAGFSPEEEMIQKPLLYILSHQQEDGSWAGSVDMTASAIQVLSLLPEEGTLRQALHGATSFLSDNQKPDGGFGNAFSTAWAMQAIEIAGNKEFSWQKEEKTPNDYLVSLQQEDGGIEGVSSESRIWASAYAIVATKPWGEILQDFPREEFIVPQPVQPSSEDMQAKLNVILKKAQDIQVQLTALKDASQHLAQEESLQEMSEIAVQGENLSNLQIVLPEFKQQQSVMGQLGAAVISIKDSLDAVTVALAVMGMGLAALLAGGMPNTNLFAKLARTVIQKRSL